MENPYSNPFVVEFLITAGPGTMLDHRTMVIDTLSASIEAGTAINDVMRDTISKFEFLDLHLSINPLDQGDAYAPV